MKLRRGPAGIHMFDRVTGLNVLLDEAVVSPELWAAAPRYVSVALTNACDLRCPFCYAPKYAAVLRKENLFAWFDELDANGCLGVGFGGGEPTLHRDFAQLCRYVAESTSMAVTFTTHAHWRDRRLASELNGFVHFIRVSMDGVGHTYEMLRGRPFDSLRRHLEVVADLAPFGINYVVNARTILDLEAAVSLAAEAGAVEFLLLPEQPVRGQGGIAPDTALALRDWVAEYEGIVRLSVSEAGEAGLPTYDPLRKEGGLRAFAHVDASGMLKRSSYAVTGVVIGAAGILGALQALEQSNGSA